MNQPPAYLAVLMLMLTLPCYSNPVEENEAMTQLQEDVEELKRFADSMRNFMEEITAGGNSWDRKAGPPGPPGSPGSAGKDGKDGRDGADGRDGTDGKDGRDGADGRDGEKGDAGQPGASGRDGVNGSGEPGPKGEPGSSEGGAVYTRWGRKTCGSASVLLYEGFAGGSRHDQRGNGVNYQCMVNDVEYNSHVTDIQYSAYLAGAEYQSQYFGIFSNSAYDQNVPCAVCHAAGRSSVMMIPGKRTCLDNNWTFEYEGYLMTEYYNHQHQTTYECVDADPEYIDGESANNDGALFYFTKAVCDKGVPCPPYDSGKAITCVVCTK